MNNAYLAGYKKMNVEELLKAIDACTSLSQLFALIQHEQIEIQMHAQSDASNIKPKKLTAKDIVGNRELPLDRLKTEVKKAVCGSYAASAPRAEDTALIKEIRATKTLSELFALIAREKIVVPMHAQSGASNVKPKKLEPKLQADTGEAPFERFKAEVIKSLREIK